MNWLITGGCGFIGRNLIKKLILSDNNIRVIDNLSVGSVKDLEAICDVTRIDTAKFKKEIQNCREEDVQGRNRVELIVGDILDLELAISAAKDMDVIVHLAANTGVGPSVEDPVLDCHTNVIGTLNYLEAARYNKVSKFIFASSGAPVGECTPPIHEELAPHPVSPYGASKLSGEGYCSAYFRTYGIQTVALRFGNVYGPLSSLKNSVVAKFIRKALKGEILEIYGDGNQTRDFIYIDDLVSAILLASEKQDVGGEVFQIATSSETTIASMADSLEETLSDFGVKNIRVEYSEPRLGDVARNYSDTCKAKNKLGWSARTELVHGLKMTVEWFINNHD
ncbi:MAG: NAD-dependent epimerase/dehydratase family protein [Proteobacteria bacterium]|nr:NAD-dependent epimerase/dehydratase family protein [Pseudomonadota bacterium]